MGEANTEPVTAGDYDFSGLPGRTGGTERATASTAMRATAILGAIFAGLVIALAGAAVAAGAAQDVAKSSVADPVTGVAPAPAFADLFIERIGQGMVVFGGVLAAFAVVMALWLVARPGQRSAEPAPSETSRAPM